MISKSARALLQSLVHACATQRLMFTAYSLTQAVRAANEFIKHEDARKVVHKMYDDGVMDPDYLRSLVDLGGANGPCYVYHHRADAPHAFVDLVATALPAAQAAAARILAGHPAPTGRQRPAGSPLPYFARRAQNERVIGSRKRISIPNALVRRAGFAMGATVYVGYDLRAGAYTYEPQMPATGAYDAVGVIHVDKSDNIRHRTGGGAQQFRIVVTASGCIRAEPVVAAPPHQPAQSTRS